MAQQMIGTMNQGLDLRQHALVQQFQRFVLVGTSNTAVSFGVLNLCLMLASAHTQGQLLLFSTIAFFLSTLNSYVWNGRWTFAGAGYSQRTARRFAALNLLMLGLNSLCVLTLTAAVPQFVTLDTITLANLSAIAATMICGLSNFFLSRRWVFSS